ncbi:SusD/RagB family nutrient-binding outer membrane lipoprotein [Neotamlana laminarinivorans]|uniref:SusD/RagB family nutrient-binding outer membrane lipoprotein n=1 Tax=Neotamlana laminarinivorans TaxID=2883124 RepID=A0A9X1HZW9_9FLAO|nr:SusD/RagB family nutrient-binding outer membrane lipoprotein [Tamlana laminarinivorans]MCB4799238.1 SusD/RagB family nutrient-binding outer membrane lipoprotein [Tamlana laminarinivorans]
MKKIKYILLLMLISNMFVLTSCDKDFEEVNSNPNDPSTVPANLLLAGIIRGTGNTIQSSFNSGETGSCWAQHLGKPIYNSNELYIPRQSTIDGVWSNLYNVVAKDASIMAELAIEEGNNNLQGVALILQANAFHIMTDLYGDIPFSESLKGDEGIITPIYDDSETEIYPGILDMLDQAITLLDGTGEIDSSQDILYGGDYSLWKKLAGSLKFKALMRYAEGGNDVSSQLQALVDSGNLFTSNEDQAALVYLSAEPNANPFYEALVNGGRTTEWCLGEELVNYMLDTNDPRLAAYAQEVGGDGSGNGYVGKPAGIFDIGSSFYGDSNNVSLIGTLYLEAEAPYYFMTYAHLSFLMAEAAEKGYISGDAAEYFNTGIASSVTDNLVSGAPSVSYISGDTGLELIAEQLWVSLYMQGFEAWAEYRRTGIPELPLAIDAVESSIPSRFTYPSTQQSLNNVNYTAAVADQGADELTTPLWWQN